MKNKAKQSIQEVGTLLNVHTYEHDNGVCKRKEWKMGTINIWKDNDPVSFLVNEKQWTMVLNLGEIKERHRERNT